MASTLNTADDARPSIRIVEVSPRDGLQNVPGSIPFATKIDLVRRLHEAGLESVEVASLVSPKAIPQMADSQLVLANPYIQEKLQDRRLRCPVLVPNTKGLSRALKQGVREVAVFVSATEGFSKANTNATVEQGLARARKVAVDAIRAGLEVRGYVSCIFADPYTGPTAKADVLRAVRELLSMGCYEVSLGDTLGVGTAADVRSLLAFLKGYGLPMGVLAGHFHDTYGQAVANVWEAYQAGVGVFDSSVGGLGGCPFAPGAKGNVATEDLVYMFERAGVHTGVDLGRLVQTGDWISRQLNKSNDSRAGAALVTRASLDSTDKKRMPPDAGRGKELRGKL